MSLYPKAPETPASVTPVDPKVIADRIIEGMETGQITFPFTTAKFGDTYTLPGKSKGDFAGPCLRLPDDPDPDPTKPGRGSDDVATFDQVWEDLHQEQRDLTGVSVAAHATEVEYVAALAAKATYLDAQKWADGTVAAAEVADFAALKTKLAGEP